MILMVNAKQTAESFTLDFILCDRYTATSVVMVGSRLYVAYHDTLPSNGMQWMIVYTT